MKVRGNPNFGKLCSAIPDLPTQYEVMIEKLHLMTDQEVFGSLPLKQWARRNVNKHYIPEWLLEGWGIEGRDDYSGNL